MLDIDWYSKSPIDFEYKNWTLLAYLKEIDESYSVLKLSPYLLWTEKLVYELKTFEKMESQMSKLISKKSIDFKSFKIKEVIVGGEIKEVIEIVNYSIPLLESKIKLGYKLFDKYPQILYNL